MKFIAIAALAAALMGCTPAPARLTYNDASRGFTNICVPNSINVTLQQNDDQAMLAATCTKVK